MARRKNLGLSLIEILVVVTIILILVAISYPVFMRAKERTGEVVTKSNLHQLWIAMAVYRTEHDGDGYYGHHTLMGLPNTWDVDRGFSFGLPQEVWRSGCLNHPNVGDPKYWSGKKGWIHYLVYDDELSYKPKFEEFARRQQEHLIVFQDLNCNDKKILLADPATKKRNIGVALNGTLRTKTSTGVPTYLDWWEES